MAGCYGDLEDNGFSMYMHTVRKFAWALTENGIWDGRMIFWII